MKKIKTGVLRVAATAACGALFGVTSMLTLWRNGPVPFERMTVHFEVSDPSKPASIEVLIDGDTRLRVPNPERKL